MGKNKAKKGDGSNTRMITTLAVAGGVFLLRKLLATVWTRVTGKVPPTDLTDPKVTLPEALAWAIATGIVIETARFAFLRSTMRKSLQDTGAESTPTNRRGISGWPGPPASRFGWCPADRPCRAGGPAGARGTASPPSPA